MEENKMFTKPQYKCAICGEIYDRIPDRMNCEMQCLKKQQEEAKKAAEAKKKAEKAQRKKEVDDALKHFAKLAEAYAKDYGSYEYDGEPIHNVLWPSKIWHNFFF